MTIGSNKHKKSWAEEQMKNAYESIWVIDISLFENGESILAKKRELERIEQRIAEKFYPTARDGKEDKELRSQELAGLEGNRERMHADRKRYEDQMATIERFLEVQ